MATGSRSRLHAASSADTACSGPQEKEAAEERDEVVRERGGEEGGHVGTATMSDLDGGEGGAELGGVLRAAGARRNRPVSVVEAARRSWGEEPGWGGPRNR